jgi:pimeloyl-ACP methyl ester carboxylesterase
MRTVTVAGRTLEVATVGDSAGDTVVVHHGSPGDASGVSMLGALAADGFFLVSVSRPGYGESTRREGRRVADVVGDVDAVLDALGRATYQSVGWSGGGPHSLACAVMDPTRCVGAWSLAGVAPIDVDFEWTEGMAPENVAEFALAREGGPAYEAHIAGIGEVFATATADNVIGLFGELLTPVDRAALADEARRAQLAASCRRAFAHGIGGFLDDDRAFFAPWGFDVADAAVPVAIWYGDRDAMVPPTHGAWLAAHSAHATVMHRPDEGHVSLVVNHLNHLSAALRDGRDE